MKLAWALALSLWAGAAARADVELQDVLVKPGDTLWGISQKFLQDPSRWDEILKHNRLPSSDPAVALPGMILRVPVYLIKEDLRAAKLVLRINQVLFRRKETADWKPTTENMELFRNDSLRTLDESRARVKFLNEDLLQLDANSMAVIKPLNRDYDVELKRAGTFIGRAKIVTASARITPQTKDTKYAATVRNDLSTLVEVYTGKANVEAEGQTVAVGAGMATNVKIGLAPSVPNKIADLPAFEARIAQFETGVGGGASTSRAAVSVSGSGVRAGLGNAPSSGSGASLAPSGDELKAEVDLQRVGEPISGYRVQISPNQEFDRVVFDKSVDSDEELKPWELRFPPGRYWVRLALIDLLGTQGRYAAPKMYNFSNGRLSRVKTDLLSRVTLTRPAADEVVESSDYRVAGRARDGVNITINGRPARVDGDGNFGLGLVLSPGENTIRVTLMDDGGNTDQITRRVVFKPQ
jgi:hypothetical protein